MPRRAADSSVYSVIADPVRRSLMQLLLDGARKPSELGEATGSSASAVSQHLAVLLSAGLVQRERKGREQHYSLRPEPLREVSDWVMHFDRFWSRKLDALGGYLEDS